MASIRNRGIRGKDRHCLSISAYFLYSAVCPGFFYWPPPVFTPIQALADLALPRMQMTWVESVRSFEVLPPLGNPLGLFGPKPALSKKSIDKVGSMCKYIVKTLHGHSIYN